MLIWSLILFSISARALAQECDLDADCGEPMQCCSIGYCCLEVDQLTFTSWIQDHVWETVVIGTLLGATLLLIIATLISCFCPVCCCKPAKTNVVSKEPQSPTIDNTMRVDEVVVVQPKVDPYQPQPQAKTGLEKYHKYLPRTSVKAQTQYNEWGRKLYNPEDYSPKYAGNVIAAIQVQSVQAQGQGQGQGPNSTPAATSTKEEDSKKKKTNWFRRIRTAATVASVANDLSGGDLQVGDVLDAAEGVVDIAEAITGGDGEGIDGFAVAKGAIQIAGALAGDEEGVDALALAEGALELGAGLAGEDGGAADVAASALKVTKGIRGFSKKKK